ncbi:class I adenylate-forming enzyme family protein [Bradyrhizobium sp. Arg237L]|uniref:class I adenylate-forming enzyme family protein n=1 Tax=Bradyrhizobium sp. Arg237L TaxID=3003352 RepID=UPI00249DD9E6|nr:class I adenylate-forming enzyme family protein [Bradyrhizobium sp. Arg237L]MDI4235615.1 class I adenylate-forming enzyme family protein [Bradyrhizobium sp. Arg237L]
MRWHNLGYLIDRRGNLDKEAIIDLALPGGPRIYTHRQVDQLANGVAKYLTDRGFSRGTHIAILSFNRAEYVAAYFGIMRAGCIAVPVNIKVARDTIDYVMDDAKIALAFVDAANRHQVREGIPVIDFDDAGPNGFAASIKPFESFDSVVAGPDEVGQMLYTSGSTGRPKGVPLSHLGQLWALSTRTSGALNESERYIIAQPLFHMNGLFATKTIFATNASVVLLPSFETRSYIEAIAKYKATAATAVPTMWARVVKERDLLAQNDITSVRRLMLGSAPMTMGLWDKIKQVLPNVTLSIGYGTTEAGPAVFGPHPKGIPTPPLALGYPIDPETVKLINGTENEGVLLMRNPALMDHYHNLPQQTAKAITDGWYYSGDVMRRDGNGFYYFVGRADDMFVCSGENVYPGEVEKLLERHPQVQQAAVVPLPDEERSQVPVAFIVTRADAKPTADDIRKFTIANGPAYQHPRRIEFVNELPWAGTNKIDRKSLIDRARQLEAAKGWSA